MDSENNSTRPAPEELKELLDNDEIRGGARSDYLGRNRSGRGLDFLYDVPLQVSVEIGRSRILLRDLLRMGEGYVIELDKMAGEPLDLYVNSRLIARGEAVMVGEKFGIRLTEVLSTADRIEKLG
ncbi:MAG: flagellar motor switch protein FliN [Desulfopila sp.]